MPGNNRVFISHSHDDNARCAPLLAAMDAWGVNYWFDTEGGLSAGQHLTERVQRAMAERDVFLRICTGATQQSFWMNLETNAFRGLIAEEQRKGRGSKRVLINLILSGDYTREPFDNATLFIDAASRPQQEWLDELARALGVSTPAGQQKVSRRAVLGYGVAAAVTIGSTAAAGALFIENRRSAVSITYAPGKVVWRIDGISFKKDVPAWPLVDGDTLYVMTGADLSARPLSDRTHVIWHKQFNPKETYVSATIANGTVYTGVDATLFAFKAADGSKVWAVNLPSEELGNVGWTPVVAGDALYVMSDRGNLYSLKASDGSKRWADPVEMVVSSEQRFAGPTVDGDTVYIGSLDHYVYAFSARDGSQKWKFLTRGQVISSPQVADGVVYVGSSDNYVYALNAHDGSLKWKFQTGADVQSTPTVTDGVVFIGSNDAYLYALDAETGKPYWRTPIGDIDTSDGSTKHASGTTCQPAVSPEAVCIVDSLYHVVRCYNRTNGKPRWKYEPGGDGVFQTSDPVAAGRLILFGSGDRNLYAFG
ncbi:MAG: outer membrane protein assembly factor BamB family protein, partial [Ktedonobacterales bacterium]